MPGIVYRAVPTEVALMLPDDRIAAAYDDAIGIGAHLNGPACGRRHDRVAVAIEADEAGAGDGMLALMEAVERCQDRLQGRSLHIQRLGDGNIPAFGMGMMLGPAPALGLQPPVELGQAGEPESRLEDAASDRLDLLLALALLDRKSTRLNSSH